MEYLRNYAQHQGLPISGIQYPIAWDKIGEDKQLKFSLEFYFKKESLVENRKFSKEELVGVTVIFLQIPTMSVMKALKSLAAY